MSIGNRPLTKIGGGGGRGPQLLQGRRASLLMAAVAAVVAAGLIYVVISRYHTNSTPAPVVNKVTVLVAKTAIPVGTPLTQVTALGMLHPESVPTSQAITGALTDTSSVAGQVVSTSIPAGEQVTAADFSATQPPSLNTYITGDYRAVAFPLDGPHGLTAYLAAGQRVDVMGQHGGTSQLIAQNVEVLDNAHGDIVLRVTDKQALLLTAATGVDSLWLSLRPSHRPTQSIRLGDQEKL